MSLKLRFASSNTRNQWTKTRVWVYTGDKCGCNDHNYLKHINGPNKSRLKQAIANTYAKHCIISNFSSF